MTDGTLIMKIIKDPYLSEFNIIIIDEAHERKIQIDLMLLLLKKIMLSGKRDDLKLIIMSATIDSSIYEKYFADIKKETINISTEAHYPIVDKYQAQDTQINFLKLGREVLDSIINAPPSNVAGNYGNAGDILFFVTTSNEAYEICRYITKNHPRIFCIEVYSQMAEGRKILAQDKDRYKSLGNYNRKVIIATNVAESSLTIDNLGFVIDSGYELYSYFDPNTMAHVLEKRFITSAQATQRRGRVGRTGPGICYHLYSKNDFDSMRPYPEPTILKEDITLDMIKLITLPFVRTTPNLQDVLSQLLDPPRTPFVGLGLKLMNDYKITENEKITAFGYQIAQFNSIDLGLALFLAYSYQSFVAREAAIIVSMLESINYRMNNLFDLIDKQSYAIPKAVNALAAKNSDHLSMLNFYNSYIASPNQKQWLYKHQFRSNVFTQIESKSKKLYYQTLRIMQSKEPQEEEILDARVVEDRDPSSALLVSLRNSHLHQIAHKTGKNIATLYPHKKSKVGINRNSFVHKIPSNADIIYNELTQINNNYELNIITVV
jgi:HrpA-like RNA helicase